MTLLRDWEAIDATKPREKGARYVYTVIPKGVHEIERIPNPSINNGTNWLVLKGTKIGASEGSWLQWSPCQTCDDPKHPNFGKVIDWGTDTVVVTEEYIYITTNSLRDLRSIVNYLKEAKLTIRDTDKVGLCVVVDAQLGVMERIYSCVSFKDGTPLMEWLPVKLAYDPSTRPSRWSRFKRWLERTLNLHLEAWQSY